jgi:hypothetical protein
MNRIKIIGGIYRGRIIEFPVHINGLRPTPNRVRETLFNWLGQDLSGMVAGPYESGLLKLNCDKALHYLEWRAVMGFEDTVRMTAEWYRAYYEQQAKIAAMTYAQIAAYTSVAKQQGLGWAQ